MKVGGDALAFLPQYSLPLHLVQLVVQQFEVVDQLSLVLVEPRIVYRHRHLVGKRREQALIVLRVSGRTVGHADHPDRVVAYSQRNTQVSTHRGMAIRLANASGVVEDVVGHDAAAFADDHPEEVRANRNRSEPVVEARVRGFKPLDCRNIHHVLGAVQQPDEAELRVREIEAIAERTVEDRRKLVDHGDLDRNRVQR